MPLSPNILAEIVGRHGARPDGGAGGRLRFPLRDCNAHACHEPPEGEVTPFEIRIVDLALRGLGFQTRTPLKAGDCLTVALKIPGIPTQNWHCRVVGVHRLEGEVYCVGAAIE